MNKTLTIMQLNNALKNNKCQSKRINVRITDSNGRKHHTVKSWSNRLSTRDLIIQLDKKFEKRFEPIESILEKHTAILDKHSNILSKNNLH